MKRYNFSDQLQQVIREAENRALEERHAVIVPVHLMTSLLELKDPKVELARRKPAKVEEVESSG